MRKLLMIAAPAIAAALLAGCATPSLPDRSLPSALEAGWKGERVCSLQHLAKTHRVLRCTFPPGVGHERHFHPKHYGYALSGGTMQLTSAEGARTATLETGSDYSSDGTEWHEVVNVGATTVTYLIVEEL
jgi:beta-alanine degradation protein BauB